MRDVLFSALVGSVVGMAGTGTGGVLACLFGRRGERFLHSMLGLSSGIMLAVVGFHLLPHSISMAGTGTMAAGALVGSAFMWLLQRILRRNRRVSRVYSVGVLLFLGMAIHNFPEGLAVGAGLEEPAAMSFSLCLLIMLHDVPEGIALGIPLKLGGMQGGKVIALAVLSGAPTMLGAVVGNAIGKISHAAVAGSIAFAGGAMLYLTLWELIPETMNTKGKKAAYSAIFAGILLGAAVVYLV